MPLRQCDVRLEMAVLVTDLTHLGMLAQAVAALCVFLALAAPCFGRSLLAPTAAPPTAAGVTDVDLLNFALNLEYLEAEFYSCAAFGTPLNSELRGGGPASTGCQKAALGPDIQVCGCLSLRQSSNDEVASLYQCAAYMLCNV